MNPDIPSTACTAELSILQSAVENANEAFVTIDQDSTVIFFNKAAEQLFGYGRAEVIGKNLGQILGPACRAGHDRAVAAYVQTGQAKLIGHETEFTIMRKNGENFSASISFSVAKVDGNLFFTGIIRDLTETKALQEQIINAERLAALGQAVAEINHEIKNPLAMIGGFANQLKKNTDNPKNREKIEIIVTEVQRLENLLVELKNLYSPKALQIEKINVSAMLHEILALVAEECRNRGINIEFNAENDENIIIEGDKQKLKQVLLNVIKNSMEAMSEGGNLLIKATATAKDVEISVIDEGPGIPAETQKQIFKPFFTTKKKGTGLGLCVSKRIIEDHKGSTFTLESEEGKGTTVKINMQRQRSVEECQI